MQASWVEIPVTNLERAMQFYQTIFHLAPTPIIDDGVRRITILANPTPEGRPGIHLNQTQHFTPNDQGMVVSSEVDGDLNTTLVKSSRRAAELSIIRRSVST